METFVLGFAKDPDIPELYSFLFENPDANLRRRDRSELERMVQSRSFYIARDGADRLIASCYIAAPTGKDPEWELGGLFTAKDLRGSGIASALSLMAVGYHYLMHQPSEDLIAHVLLSNTAPRHTLERLGFVIRNAAQKYPRDEIQGLEHMEADAEGNIHADVYVLPHLGYRGALERLRPLVARSYSGGDALFRFDLPFLSVETIDAALDDFRD
jgi:RimJ/RimL family protein N-acetyltransferase